MFNDFWEKLRLGVTFFIIAAVIIMAIVVVTLFLFANLDIFGYLIVLFVIIYAIGHFVYKKSGK